MASTVDLVIRVLADTGSAGTSMDSLGGKLGKIFGAAGAGLAVGSTIKAATDLETAMSRIQVAVNNADFAPGTTKYDAMKAHILDLSTTLATSFDDIAEVVAQGSRYITESGDKLSPAKLDEYTNAVIRMSKLSSDNLSPTAAGRQMDIISKLFPGREEDFQQIASEIIASAQAHNQGEQTLLQSVIAIGQSGGAIGVTPEQSIATANLLSDIGLGGRYGGMVIGRALTRMNAAADLTLDPDQSSAAEKKQRDGAEKLSDLQSDLAIAEQRRSQMYGQHGLKTEYKKDPAALMESDQRIAKLQREIADQQADSATEQDKATRGQANLSAMAGLLGEDKTQFAQEFKDDPMDAFMRWEHAVSQQPQNERLSDMSKAFGTTTGVINAQDLRVMQALGSPGRQDTIELYRQLVEQQKNTPNATDLANIPLSTTQAHLEEMHNAARGAQALAGDPLRQELDAGLTKALAEVHDKGFAPLVAKMQDMDTVVEQVNSGLGQFIQQIGIGGALALGGGAITLLKAGGAAFGALGGAGGLAGAAGGVAAGAGGLLAGGVVAGAFGSQFLDNIKLLQSELDAYNSVAGKAGLQPINVNFGDLLTHPGDAEAAGEEIKQKFIAAFNAAMNHEPVPNQVGGNLVSGQAPRGP